MLKISPKRDVRTWIEINRKAIGKNYQTFRSMIPATCKLMSVVKSNAYGHGLVDFSKEIVANGVDWLGVDSVVEALALREEEIVSPILVLGYTLPERFFDAAEKNISITISSKHSLELLQKLSLKKKIKVHIKVDTGMHRQGFLQDEIEWVIEFLKKHTEVLEVEGLYTHFATAKNPALSNETKRQLEVFKKWQTAFKEAGLKPIVHAASTGAALLFPEAHFDMVRIGIGFYGLWPAQETRILKEKNLVMHPALTWKTIVAEIKTIKKGEGIGYDFTEILKKDSTIAVCPIGYWHGYPRSLSSVGEVLVRGKRARVVGRVSMDMIVIDVTSIEGVEVGDEVVLIGNSSTEYISPEELATYAGTVNYEIITRINPLIKKIYN